MSLTVGDLIEALGRFPRDCSICIGNGDCDVYGIKGIIESSESDDFGYLMYDYVEIELMEDLCLDELMEGKIELYGDNVWYNTKDTFQSVFGDLSNVKYQLNTDGCIEIVECKNRHGDDIPLDAINDIDEDDGGFYL